MERTRREETAGPAGNEGGDASAVTTGQDAVDDDLFIKNLATGREVII